MTIPPSCRAVAIAGALTLASVGAVHAEPFVFTLNGNFYGGFSLSGTPIADGTPFTETATFNTSTPNLLPLPGTAVYVPSQATIAFNGTTYQLQPYSAAHPFGVNVSIFDRSSPFPATPEYGVGIVGNDMIAGAGIIADFLSATPNISAANLMTTTFPASAYVGSGIFPGVCTSAPSTCFTATQTLDVEPYSLTANGQSYSLTFPQALVTYYTELNDPNAPAAMGVPGLTIYTTSSATLTDVPEPASALLLALGLTALTFVRSIRRF
jgi:uncharacterized membrane protein